MLIMKTAIDMTDAEDLASEKRDIVKAKTNLKKQQAQYYNKRYKALGGAYFVKAVSLLWDVLFVVLFVVLLIAFLYLFITKNETSNTIYLSCNNSGTAQISIPTARDTRIILPQELPPTWALRE